MLWVLGATQRGSCLSCRPCFPIYWCQQTHRSCAELLALLLLTPLLLLLSYPAAASCVMLSLPCCLAAAAVAGLLAPLPVSKLRQLGGKFGEEVMAKLSVSTVGELVSTASEKGCQC